MRKERKIVPQGHLETPITQQWELSEFNRGRNAALIRFGEGAGLVLLALALSFVDWGDGKYTRLWLLVVLAIVIGRLAMKQIQVPEDLSDPFKNDVDRKTNARKAYLFRQGVRLAIRWANIAVGIGLIGLLAYSGWLALS